MRSAGAARTAGTAAAVGAAGDRPSLAGSIEQRQFSLNRMTLAASTGGFGIGVFHTSDQLKFYLAILALIFINGHSNPAFLKILTDLFYRNSRERSILSKSYRSLLNVIKGTWIILDAKQAFQAMGGKTSQRWDDEGDSIADEGNSGIHQRNFCGQS